MSMPGQPQQGQMPPQMMQMLQQLMQQRGQQGAPQQQGQPGAQQQAQQQNPPAQIPPQALMALLTYLAQTGGGVQGQAPPTNANQLQGPEQLQMLLPMLMQRLGQQGPSPQQQAQQQQQQMQQQQQQQQQQGPQALLHMLSQMGLKLGS